MRGSDLSPPLSSRIRLGDELLHDPSATVASVTHPWNMATTKRNSRHVPYNPILNYSILFRVFWFGNELRAFNIIESYVQKLQMEGTELLSFITFPRSQIQVPLHKLKDHASPGISELANSLIFNKGFGVWVDLTSPNITYPDVHWHLTWHSCKLTKSVVYQTLQFFLIGLQRTPIDDGISWILVGCHFLIYLRIQETWRTSATFGKPLPKPPIDVVPSSTEQSHPACWTVWPHSLQQSSSVQLAGNCCRFRIPTYL